MKKLLVLLTLLIGMQQLQAQVPISALPTITTDVTGGWVPVVIGGVTRKTDAKNLGNLDSLSITQGTTYDTLKVYKNAVLKYYKLIRAGSTFDTTAVYAAIGLKLNISDTTGMLTPYVRRTELQDSTNDIRTDLNGKQPAGDYATNTQVNQVQSNLDTTRNGIRGDLNGKISNITGLVTAGTNVTITGSGTSGSPYVVNASGGSTSDSIQNHISGTTVTVGNAVNVIYINPASTLATLTITLPATPHTSNVIEIYFGGTMTSGEVVTAITISPNTGQTLLQAGTLSSIEAGEHISYRWNNSLSKWFRKN